MSGPKKTYNIESKNYFEFFGMEEKFSISQRSLTAHYKKVSAYIRSEIKATDSTEMQVILNDRLSFANDAFQTLLNPLERARYIISLNNCDNDIRDTITAEDMSFVNELSNDLEHALTEEDVELFQETLKEQSDFIIDQIEKNIDQNKNYVAAASLVGTWYDLRELYEQSKTRLKKMQDGITFVAF